VVQNTKLGQRSGAGEGGDFVRTQRLVIEPDVVHPAIERAIGPFVVVADHDRLLGGCDRSGHRLSAFELPVDVDPEFTAVKRPGQVVPPPVVDRHLCRDTAEFDIGLSVVEPVARELHRSLVDVALQHLFAKRPKGVYVDVGCFHPRKHSNTYGLYRSGWSGINVDVSELKIRLFRTLRPRDHSVLAAATSQRCEVTLYHFGPLSVFDTLDENKALAVQKQFGKRYTEQRLQGAPLREIIAESPFSPSEIDLLSIDVEGHELSVLDGFDLDLHQPAVVVLELHAEGIEQVLSSELYARMQKAGYRLTYWLRPSLIFQPTERTGQIR